MKQLEVPIVLKSYEVYQLLYLYQKHIPKSERYTLWQSCKNSCLKIIEKLIYTGYVEQSKRLNLLINTSVELDLLRTFLRLSTDIKILNQKKYIQLQSDTDEIGRMLGGWIKSLKLKEKKR